jgi:hypothetical protein
MQAWLLALALMVPFVGAGYVGQVLAPRGAAAAGQVAARGLSRLSPAPIESIQATAAVGETQTTAAALRVEQGTAQRSSAAAHKLKKSRVRGLMVRAAVVLRAIRAGSRPTGSPTAASGLRPAGLVLHGISRYGSALRDGDVLTSISGAKATASSVVVGAVISAIQARSPVITGVVWRGQERYAVTVELPWS